MKRTRLFALLIALSMVLSGCGEEKKINMNNSAPNIAPTSSNASSVAPNPSYVEAFGEHLAPFHNVSWKENFFASDAGTDYNISINTITTVKHPLINTVTFIDFVLDDDEFRGKCFDTFFGDQKYSHQLSIFPYENAYNRACLGKEHLAEMIQKAIDDGASDKDIESSKNKLRFYEAYIEELKEAYQKKLKEVNNNPELTEDPNAFFAHNPSGNGIISITFDHKFEDADYSYNHTLYTDELDNFNEVNITGLPAPFDINNGNDLEKLEFLNSILGKLDLPLCNTAEGSYESGILKAYQSAPQYERYNDGDVDILAFDCFPAVNSTLHVSEYYATFNGETVDICIASPCRVVQSIDDVPLLGIDEIKAIAKNELSRNISEYKKYANKNHELSFDLDSIVFENVIDANSNSVIPAWCFYAQNVFWGGVPIFYINAIDGSVFITHNKAYHN